MNSHAKRRERISGTAFECWLIIQMTTLWSFQLLTNCHHTIYFNCCSKTVVFAIEIILFYIFFSLSCTLSKAIQSSGSKSSCASVGLSAVLSLLTVVSLHLLMVVSSDDVAVIRKTELTKKMEPQTQSPSKRTVMKPAVRQTRPTQHHSCPRRRPTGDTLPWSVTQVVLSASESHQNTSSHHVFLHCQLQFGFDIHFVLLVTAFFFHLCFFAFDHNKNWLPYVFHLASFVFVHILLSRET